MSNIVIGKNLAEFRSERAACLPYTVRNKVLYFLFAKDKKSDGDITDMGGGVKKDEFALNAGLRELSEESGGVFSSLCRRINEMNMFIGGISQNRKMSVLFIPLDHEKWKDIDKILNPSDEVIQMIWVSEYELYKLLNYNNKQMWKRVKHFYRPLMTHDLKNRLKVLHEQVAF